MATEEQKKKNLMRLMTLQIKGLAKALHELFGEAAFATMATVGKDILEIMEKEQGLEIAGQTPKDVITEIGRVFSDEMGFIESFQVTEEGKNVVLTLSKCQGWDLTQEILKTGVDVPFTCPIMNVGQAALARMGKSARKKIEPIPATRGSKITWTLID
jgi:hypothetical protein